MHMGDTRQSPSGLLRLIYGKDGTLGLYDCHNVARAIRLWSQGAPNSFLSMQGDGNLVLYQMLAGGRSKAVWSTGTWGHPGAFLLLQDDGNMVVYQGNNALWSSGTYKFAAPVGMVAQIAASAANAMAGKSQALNMEAPLPIPGGLEEPENE